MSTHGSPDEAGAGGLLQRLLDLSAALRRAGVEATQSETLDAVRAFGHLDLLDREQIREALAAVTITSPAQRPTFDELFDLYFPAHTGLGGLDPDLHTNDEPSTDDELPTQGADTTDPDELLQALLESLQQGDPASIRQRAQEAVETWGRVESRDGTASYFQYKVMRAIDQQQLLQELLSREQEEGELTELMQQLYRDEFEARLAILTDEIATEVRRRTAAQHGLDRTADRLRRPSVEEIDFFHHSPEDQARLRAQIAPLARKLASRVAVKRRSGRQGRLDVRRTVRRSLSTGGVPFDPSYRSRRPHKPELFVLCDVSGSVASFARFTLMLVHALQEQFTKVRSFAFIDTLDEVTSLFEQGDIADALQRMLHEADLVWSDGHSDYGNSLERFQVRYAADLSPRSTVLILGDARNNYRQANAWVLQDIERRSRQVYWLNPEPIQFWDTGDSIASNYGRFVDDMVEVRNLRQLAAFVERIA